MHAVSGKLPAFPGGRRVEGQINQHGKTATVTSPAALPRVGLQVIHTAQPGQRPPLRSHNALKKISSTCHKGAHPAHDVLDTRRHVWWSESERSQHGWHMAGFFIQAPEPSTVVCTRALVPTWAIARAPRYFSVAARICRSIKTETGRISPGSPALLVLVRRVA
jgi:hypothetical protein